jgi:hypothetical protein
MKQILDLLKAIDDANPENKLCSIKFYQDGSGVIYNEETEIAGFDTCEEAIVRLEIILNTHLKSKASA